MCCWIVLEISFVEKGYTPFSFSSFVRDVEMNEGRYSTYSSPTYSWETNLPGPFPRDFPFLITNTFRSWNFLTTVSRTFRFLTLYKCLMISYFCNRTTPTTFISLLSVSLLPYSYTLFCVLTSLCLYLTVVSHCLNNLGHSNWRGIRLILKPHFQWDSTVSITVRWRSNFLYYFPTKLF